MVMDKNIDQVIRELADRYALMLKERVGERLCEIEKRKR